MTPSRSTSRLVENILAAIGSTQEVAEGPVRVGIDVVGIAEFSRMLATSGGKAMAASSFTLAEQQFCAGRVEHLAVRWAAKEAAAKAMGTGFRGVRPGDIEVIHHADGHPTMEPAEGTIWPRGAHRWYWSLSLCHEEDAAIAVAVATIRTTQLIRAPHPVTR
jgi:holo-[acyl-carrier protein] synthase